METVFLSSDIAHMVLGYLRKQRLDEAAEMFCKTSPFLEKQSEVLKQGFRIYIFKEFEDMLENIIKEYCKITTKVDKVIETMPLDIRETLQQQKSLSSKVSSLIHYNNNSSTVIENKENSTNAKKRKRLSIDSVDGEVHVSRDDDIMRPPKPISKRSRASHSNCDLVSNSKRSSSKDYEILSQSESYDLDSEEEENSDLSPKQSTSTPQNSKINQEEEFALPTEQDMAQALLENPEFQTKLAKKINTARESLSLKSPKSGDKAEINLMEELNRLETVVKSATEATEEDPMFNDFIQELVSQINSTDSLSNISSIEKEAEPQQAKEQPHLQLIQASSTARTQTTGTTNTISNASFGSLIESNFSISRLVVSNSNDNTQKPQNTSRADSVLLTAPDNNQIVNTTLDNQMFFDSSTALLLTNEGLLPFLLNNELMQQLQGEVPVEVNRIEVPMPEQIILTADQLPPNTVILGSAHKVEKAEDLQKSLAKAKLLPNGSGLESRITQDGTTPSAGITHSRSFKSLSTPRKKSHVRTLNFSPLPAHRKLLKKVTSTFVEESPQDKPVIKNVEILPMIEIVPEPGVDSENSNSVENTNQTVINQELADTPKRKANSKRVKRVLSKSEEDDTESKANEHSDMEQTKNESGTQTKKLEIPKSELEEWQKMRAISQNNFDYYLREVNAKCPNSMRRDPPRKKKRRVLTPKTQAALAKRMRAKKRQKQVKEKTPPPSSTKKKKDTPSKSIFNIKIPTPHKSETGATTAKRNSRGNSSKEKISTVDDEVVFVPPQALSGAELEEQREKRTANIACLLDTPFKSVEDATFIPPTPGIVPSTLDTPLFKMANSYRNHSDAKQNKTLTPQFAITPGCNLTPFTKETPKSAAQQTDYSSGGSYYRPDESDDLDKKIEKQLRESAQKKKEETTPAVTPVKSADVVEEKIPCEPNILERVKSFGEEDTPPPPVELHYTLAAGLPELSDGEEEIATSTLSSSSTSSSSSRSTSSSSTSSSSSSSSSASSVVAPEKKNLNTSVANIEDLSEISSAEDDDWEKASAKKDVIVEVLPTEDSQLVSNNWEIRYPVRSWLTPKKAEISEISTQADEKHAIRRKQLSELEQKKQRMKTKLSIDSKNNTPQCSPCIKKGRVPKTPLPTSKPKPLSIRKQYVMSTVTTSEKKVMKVVSAPPVQKVIPVSNIDITPPEPSIEQIDVLTALNLSAKKNMPESPNGHSPLVEKNDKKSIKPMRKKIITTEAEPLPKKIKSKHPKLVKSPVAQKTSAVKPTKIVNNSPIRSRRQSSRAVRVPKAFESYTTTTGKRTTIGAPTPSSKRKPKVSAIVKKTKIKSGTSLDPVVMLKSLSVKSLSLKKEEEKISPTPSKPISIKSSPETPKSIEPPDPSDNVIDDDEEEDDPYDHCEIIAIDETDLKRFQVVSYNGPDGPPAIPARPMKSFELNIYMNKDEKHCVKASNELLLYSAAPKETLSIHKTLGIRNIPKKRQIKLSISEKDSNTDVTTTTSCIEPKSLPSSSSLSSAQRTVDFALSNLSTSVQEFASPLKLTSTPIVPKLQKVLTSRDETKSKSQQQKKTEVTTCSSSSSSSSTKNITSRSKDDKKSSTQSQSQLPSVSSSRSNYKESKPTSSSSLSNTNRSHESDNRISIKTTRTKTPADTAESKSAPTIVSSTTITTTAATSSTDELPIDIDTILSHLHGK